MLPSSSYHPAYAQIRFHFSRQNLEVSIDLEGIQEMEAVKKMIDDAIKAYQPWIQQYFIQNVTSEATWICRECSCISPAKSVIVGQPIEGQGIIELMHLHLQDVHNIALTDLT